MDGEVNLMKKEVLLNLLKSTKLFQYLDTETMKSVMSYGHLINFSDQEVILTQGKPGCGLFVLVDGKASITVKLLGKEEIQLTHLFPGQFFGEVNLLENIPCTATVKSSGKSTCFLLDKSVFDMLSVEFPQVRYLITQALIEEVIYRQKAMLEEIEAYYSNVPLNKISLKESKKPKKKILKLLHEEKIKTLAYLHKLPLFNLFKKSEMHNLIDMGNVVTISDRFRLIQTNKLNQSCFLILKGAVRVGAPSKQGMVKFTVLGPNKLICSTSLVNQEAELFEYETCGPVTLLEVTYDQLRNIEKENQAMWYKCHDMMCRYIVSLQGKLNTEMVRMVPERNGVKNR
jgi:CRP/FNR family transcriptional regulator, cyclic AMP receptor protein